MKEKPFLVEPLKKLLRRSATTQLHNLLLRVRPADPAEVFHGLDEPGLPAVPVVDGQNVMAGIVTGRAAAGKRGDITDGCGVNSAASKCHQGGTRRASAAR
ncbi:MAG TPA: hypothetical protein VFG08_01295 [Candidatus Polarisedimenticolia bacterium]|nr:hypothetical protein [Candidatus Polarisedimenticolia bacterium]